jgi:hypothetical protein
MCIYLYIYQFIIYICIHILEYTVYCLFVTVASIIQSLQRQTWQEAFDPKNKQQGAIAIGEKFKLTALFLTGVNCCGKSWP